MNYPFNIILDMGQTKKLSEHLKYTFNTDGFCHFIMLMMSRSYYLLIGLFLILWFSASVSRLQRLWLVYGIFWLHCFPPVRKPGTYCLSSSHIFTKLYMAAVCWGPECFVFGVFFFRPSGFFFNLKFFLQIYLFLKKHPNIKTKEAAEGHWVHDY